MFRKAHWSTRILSRRATFEPRRGEIIVRSALAPIRATRRAAWMALGAALGALLTAGLLQGCGAVETDARRAYCNEAFLRCQDRLESLCKDSDEFCPMRPENQDRRARYLRSCSDEYDACWEVAVTIPEVCR